MFDRVLNIFLRSMMIERVLVFSSPNWQKHLEFLKLFQLTSEYFNAMGVFLLLRLRVTQKNIANCILLQYFIECVPLIIFYHQYFLCISKVSNMLHHGAVGRLQSKECYLYLYIRSWLFFGFSSKNLCFYHFHIFF